jgi:single-stranded-DNA-specific exonuclease
MSSPHLPAAAWVAAEPVPGPAELEGRERPEWVASLLASRGIKDAASAEEFLEPRLEHLHDPNDLAGMPEAVERIVQAKSAGERIAIVGDYDVDGVSGTALLAAVLRACKLEVETILPRRMQEGYGFQSLHGPCARDAL